jgi:serine protease Do
MLLPLPPALAGGSGSASALASAKVSPEGTGARQESCEAVGCGFRERNPAGVAEVVESALPAVVTLRVLRLRQNYGQDSLIYRDQPEETRMGSGFFIDGDGFILTNSHIVEQADGIIVKSGDREMQAELVGQDHFLDIAVLRVNLNGRKVKFLDLGPDIPTRIGDPLVVIGNPHGLGLAVSQGIVSALSRMVPGSDFSYNYMQVDTVLRPGNSGGPVLNARGEVVGLSAFVRSDSADGSSVSFVLPMDSHVVSVVERLKKFGYSQNGYIGISGLTLDYRYADYMRVLNFKRKTGVLVTYLDKNGSAARGGIMLNDIIVSYDGNRVDDLNGLVNMITSTAIGSRVELLVFRGGKYLRPRVQVEEDPRETRDGALERLMKGNSIEIFDMFLSQLCEELVEKYELYAKQSGMYVLDVKKGGWADTNGIERGDILLTVNQTQIKTKKDLLQFFDNMRLNGQREFIMLFKRHGLRESLLVKATMNLIDH